MEAESIRPFVHAIRRVFETMVGIEVRVGEPVARHDARACADVSGIIGFSGDVAGSVVLSFPRQTACAVASRFAGLEIDEEHPDFADALGELANMVAGCAKTQFKAGMKVNISLPSVVIGREHRVSQSRTAPRIVIPCECDLGRVFVEVGMEAEKRNTSVGQAAAGVNS